MAFVASLAAIAVARAQVAAPRTDDRTLPGSPGAAAQASPVEARGTALYRSTCGFCHGINAAGGSSGPTLLTSNYVSADGAALNAFLRAGRPANGMPAFPTLSAAEVSDLSAFLISRVNGATPPRPRIDPASILVGDAAAGRRHFEGDGQCARCHSVSGDLRAIGSRYNPMVLQARMLNPRLAIGTAAPAAPARVTVTPSVGSAVSGELAGLSDFYVTLIDDTGTRRTFVRDNDEPRVEVSDPTEFHRQMLLRWKDRDMHDLTAYLATLK